MFGLSGLIEMEDRTLQGGIASIGILLIILIIVVGISLTNRDKDSCKDSGSRYGYQPSKISYDGGNCCYEYAKGKDYCIDKNDADKGEWLPNWIEQS